MSPSDLESLLRDRLGLRRVRRSGDNIMACLFVDSKTTRLYALGVKTYIKGRLCQFDREDWSWLRYLPLCIGKRGYVVWSKYDPRTQRTTAVYVHRMLAQAGPSEICDHRNRDKLDNRKSNLRIVTASQNGANRSRPSGPKSSPFRGVVTRIRKNGSKAFIVWCKLNGKSRAFGTYDSALTAARVYDREALRAYGECAQLNFPLWDSSSFNPIPTKHWANQHT